MERVQTKCCTREGFKKSCLTTYHSRVNNTFMSKQYLQANKTIMNY